MLRRFQLYCKMSSAGQHRISVRADSGTFSGTLQIQPWEQLVPLRIAAKEFETIRSRLNGFNEARKTVSAASIGCAAGADAEVVRRLQRNVSAYVVEGAGAGGSEAKLAGVQRLSGSEQRVLFSVSTSG